MSADGMGASGSPLRIVVTGVTGQVGRELLRSLQPLGELIPLSSRELDLADAEAVRGKLSALAPDVVVNPAAWTAVDKAETELAQARAINATAPAAMAEVCAARRALLIHYSTDYVFDGVRPLARRRCHGTDQCLRSHQAGG